MRYPQPPRLIVSVPLWLAIPAYCFILVIWFAMMVWLTLAQFVVLTVLYVALRVRLWRQQRRPQ